MEQIQLAEFLFKCLKDNGVDHVFGIPGDYVLPLYKTIETMQGIKTIVGTHEPCSAFSADAYARTKGLGALLVTYGVGALNAMNGIAGAYAESSPVVVISGALPTYYSQDDFFSPKYHHVVKETNSQMDAFKSITDLCLRIENPETAAQQIQKSIRQAKRNKLPVYLEIPFDLMHSEIQVTKTFNEESQPDFNLIKRAGNFFSDRIVAAENPILLLGVEVGRYQLQESIKPIMNFNKIHSVLTPLGKGVLSECQNGCLGVYAGVLSPNIELRKQVENSDLVIMIGTKVTDVNCGAFTADLKQEKLLIANSKWIGDGFMNFS